MLNSRFGTESTPEDIYQAFLWLSNQTARDIDIITMMVKDYGKLTSRSPADCFVHIWNMMNRKDIGE